MATPLSSLKFGETFRKSFTRGGTTTAQQYALAKRLQPGKARGGPCKHRKPITSGSREWQHELRREQQILLKTGYIRAEGTGRNRVYLRAAK
jgi:hypothetical protein